MREHKEVIYRLVERAEFLCEKIQKESSEYVLCHSDIHGRNIINNLGFEKIFDVEIYAR